VGVIAGKQLAFGGDRMIATDNSPSTDIGQEDVSSFLLPESDRLTPQEIERNERIEQHFPLVEKVLGKMRRKLPSHLNADDLRSAGILGLVAAAERFTPEQANTFAGYACLRIRCAILDELRRVDPCSRRSRRLAKKIHLATQEASQALGRSPSDEEVSAKLEISCAELERWREAATPITVISLDVGPNVETSDGSLHEVIADDNQTGARETTEKEDMLQFLTARITELPELQKKVLALHYFEGVRFAEIAAAFDLTEPRIYQIHKQAVAKLKSLVRAERAR
jgi:RNA polymerase sigma factor FliA